MKLYRKKNSIPMRPYVPDEDLTDIFVSIGDSLELGGMIAHNPDNYKDRWYITKAYFQTNYEEIQ